MRTIIIISIFLLTMTGPPVSAQGTSGPERFGNTLNLGVGIGYYGYVSQFMPVLHANYEFDVAKNFTLAPFITVYSYQKNQYWGNNGNPERYYYYRVTVIPVGVKGTYYFDQLLGVNSRWDFYGAGSLGFAIRNTAWESGYYGDKYVNRGSSGLYLDLHVGAEYHISNGLGLFLDVSTGISTFGLALHL